MVIRLTENAGGAGVAVAIHVLIKFCRVGLQGFDAVVDDAAVGLMADHPRQILEGQPGLVQHRVQALGQGIHRKAEHRLACDFNIFNSFRKSVME